MAYGETSGAAEADGAGVIPALLVTVLLVAGESLMGAAAPLAVAVAAARLASVTTAVVRTTLRLVLPVFTTRADCTVAPYAFHRFTLTPRTRGAYFKSDVSIP